jgi:hypothetical protein
MMKINDIVPPLELCQKIPADKFQDCAFCWQLQDQIGFVCRESGCEEIHSKEWKIEPSCCRKIKIRRNTGEQIYPAPTVQEILEDLTKDSAYFSMTYFYADNAMVVSSDKCDRRDDISITNAGNSNMAEAAMRLWLSKNIDA